MADARKCDNKDCEIIFSEKERVYVSMGRYKPNNTFVLGGDTTRKTLELCPQCAKQFEAVFERMMPEDDD